MVCCGFKAIIVRNVDVEVQTTSNPHRNSSNHSSTETVVEQGLFSLLAPQSEWTMLLEMEEPPLDSMLEGPLESIRCCYWMIYDDFSATGSRSGDRVTWISWFDGLQSHHDILQAAARRLNT